MLIKKSLFRKSCFRIPPLLIILLYSFSTVTLSSQVVSLGLDPKNALFGSDVNDPDLNLLIRVFFQDRKFEATALFESFEAIGYQNWGLGFGRTIKPFKKTDMEIAPGIEGGLIIKDHNFGFLSYGFNTDIRYYFNSFSGLSLLLNLERRTDLGVLYNDKKFIFSVYLNLMIRFKTGKNFKKERF
ncbi:hypothetical protein GWK08_06305 [Leptobacterium flavescens]|uniref:DUF3575 domain-containing protein n=1 Tax=Leptobacterium flavescens TaxID=472055 RepID=A0A6P0UQ85_9FLAO|nr:hypothetical protein [Leptobacterium flavescens]NER13043.1 hypothetical protein [Leptobacterium flavescens]